VTDERFDPGPPPSIDLEVSLGPDQIEQFHRDGFTSVERITTDEELAWLEPIYDELVGSRGSFKGGYFDLSRKYESGGGPPRARGRDLPSLPHTASNPAQRQPPSTPCLGHRAPDRAGGT
jgi:hypothetical protein